MSDARPTVTTAKGRLLRAADELFYTRGITATGVDEVVARAQVAVASLYNLFQNKDGLVIAYLQARDQRWRETWSAEVARHDDPRERLLAIFDALQVWAHDEGMSHGCAHSAAAVQLADGAHPALTVVAAHKTYLRERLTELAREAGEPSPDDAANDLLVVYEGLLACSLVDTGPALARGRELAGAVLNWAVPDRPDAVWGGDGTSASAALGAYRSTSTIQYEAPSSSR